METSFLVLTIFVTPFRVSLAILACICECLLIQSLSGSASVNEDGSSLLFSHVHIAPNPLFQQSQGHVLFLFTNSLQVPEDSFSFCI